MSDLAYRRELDGVRAIAVLSGVLFHVGYPDMTGGYVGVDIFFVLSGYLICGQTYMRLEQGTYSVTEFFARRIRRLSTAYALCFLVTALLANAFFLRSEMAVVADGFLGSITFTNNYNLLNSVGYFSTPAHENPFLHTLGRCRSRSSSTSCCRCSSFSRGATGRCSRGCWGSCSWCRWG